MNRKEFFKVSAAAKSRVTTITPFRLCGNSNQVKVKVAVIDLPGSVSIFPIYRNARM